METTITMTEFERQTLAYLLFVLRMESAVDTRNPDDILIRVIDSVSPDEFAALWRVGLNLMG